MGIVRIDQLRQQLAGLHRAERADQPGEFSILDDDSAGSVLSAPLAYGAIHEVLHAPNMPRPWFFASLIARGAADGRMIAWCDPQREIYPPALKRHGIDLDRLVLLRPSCPADELWAVTECLRCKGVGVVVATPARLTRIEARRMQLAAERGGGVGVLIRPLGPTANQYAAASRWLVEPARGDQYVRRWKVRWMYGHGRRVGESVLLEANRETHLVRATDLVADRPPQTPAIRITA